MIGTSGSGKTTYAQRVAERLDIPHIELDALFWGPNWTEAPLEEFRSEVSNAVAGENWSLDGNYSKVRDIVWGRADTVVWLDFPLFVVMARVIWRTLRRGLLRERLWSDNQESLLRGLFTKESIIWWAFTTYKRRKREYPEWFKKPEYAHINFVRLRSTNEAELWIDELGRKKQEGGL